MFNRNFARNRGQGKSNFRNTRRQRKWLLFAGIMLFVIVFSGGGFLLWAKQQIRPVAVSAKQVELTVRPGESTWSVAASLEQKRLIRSQLVFWLYVIFSNRTLQPGTYRLQPGMGVEEIAYVLQQTKHVTYVNVTIPEGFTVRQIAKKLAAEGICSESAFLTAEEQDQFSEPFLKSVSKSDKVKYRLEGYLFPDTYQFFTGEAPHDIINEMLQTFENQLTPSVYTQLKRRHVTLTQWVTEASLIEREAKVASERPLIASVIENRLHHQPPMKLQIDATLEYILGHQNIVTTTDTEIDDPYNTYKYYGLPPGPIGNPGLASLDAALKPAHTQYLFYVVKNNRSGEHFFASTYQQQLHNEQLSEENLKKFGH